MSPNDNNEEKEGEEEGDEEGEDDEKVDEVEDGVLLLAPKIRAEYGRVE